MRVATRSGPMFRLVRALTAAVIVALPGLLASCAASGAVSGAPVTTGSAGNGRVITLTKIDSLKSLFNRDYGHTRLILIFSPT